MLLQHVGEDDEMSEMSSGLAASTVDSRHHEQDLAGFPEVERSHASAVAIAPDAALAQTAVSNGAVQPPAGVAAKDIVGQVNASAVALIADAALGQPALPVGLNHLPPSAYVQDLTGQVSASAAPLRLVSIHCVQVQLFLYALTSHC